MTTAVHVDAGMLVCWYVGWLLLTTDSEQTKAELKEISELMPDLDSKVRGWRRYIGCLQRLCSYDNYLPVD